MFPGMLVMSSPDFAIAVNREQKGFYSIVEYSVAGYQVTDIFERNKRIGVNEP